VTGQLRPCSGGPPRRPLPTRSARPGAPARPRIRGSPGGCPGRAQPRTPPAHPTPGIFQPTPSAQMCPPIRALIVGTATNSRAESLAGPRIRTPAISRIPASWTRIPARLSAGHQPSDRQPSDPQPSDPSLRTPAFGPQPSDPSLRTPASDARPAPGPQSPQPQSAPSYREHRAPGPRQRPHGSRPPHEPLVAPLPPLEPIRPRQRGHRPDRPRYPRFPGLSRSPRVRRHEAAACFADCC
jgi:hypothetical protein